MKFSKAKQTELQLQELQGYIDAVKAFLDKPIGKGNSKQNIRKEFAALKARLQSPPMYACSECDAKQKTIDELKAKVADLEIERTSLIAGLEELKRCLKEDEQMPADSEVELNEAIAQNFTPKQE